MIKNPLMTAKRLMAIALIAAAAFGVARGAQAEDSSADAFYAVTEAELAGPPGSLIRSERWDLETLYKADVYRILYRSTGLHGEPIAVSGSVVVPQFSAPAGGRPVLAWAHPTSGVAQPCAPSLTEDPLHTIPGIIDMIPQGYVTVATDYPGLGTVGPHPYLVGTSAARAVLDSVRAVREFAAAGASERFIVWGHSQGGHAALFTGEMAHDYAPDLKLEGVAAAAPATRLATLFEEDYRTDTGKILASMALVSWSQVFDLPLDPIVASISEVEAVAADCIDSIGAAAAAMAAAAQLPQDYLKADLSKVEPWRTLMNDNSPGHAPAGAPVFIAQGSGDTTVNPATTRDFIGGLCGRGEAVTFVELEGVDHVQIARKSAVQAVAWIEDRFRGKPVASTCPR